MKKKLRVLLITICVLICLNLLVGCNWFDFGEKHMIAYMDAIESECKEYSVVDENVEGSCSFFNTRTPDNIEVQNKNVSIEKIDYGKGYNVKVEETEIVLDADYLIANSETFNKIVKLWDDYVWDNREAGYYKIDVNSIDISVNYLVNFDDQIFVCAYYLPQSNLLIWRGCIPLCAFRFDVTDYSLEYVGYSKNYRQNSYLVKN